MSHHPSLAHLFRALARASSGLLFPSESDAPLTPYRWRGPGEPSPGALLAAEGFAPGTLVETVAVEDFFAGVTEAREGADAADRAEADRFRALVDLLARDLAGLRAYRVGVVDVDAFVLGRHPSGAWLGLRTHLVET
jgi:hypothetical protein